MINDKPAVDTAVLLVALISTAGLLVPSIKKTEKKINVTTILFLIS